MCQYLQRIILSWTKEWLKLTQNCWSSNAEIWNHSCFPTPLLLLQNSPTPLLLGLTIKPKKLDSIHCCNTAQAINSPHAAKRSASRRLCYVVKQNWHASRGLSLGTHAESSTKWTFEKPAWLQTRNSSSAEHSCMHGFVISYDVNNNFMSV